MDHQGLHQTALARHPHEEGGEVLSRQAQGREGLNKGSEGGIVTERRQQDVPHQRHLGHQEHPTAEQPKRDPKVRLPRDHQKPQQERPAEQPQGPNTSARLHGPRGPGEHEGDGAKDLSGAKMIDF